MSNKGVLHTVSKGVVTIQYLPHIVTDIVSRLSKCAPVSQRYLGPTMKAFGELGLEIYLSHSDVLSKDLNPTSSAINREVTATIQNVVNVRKGDALHKQGDPEIQEEFFFAGQSLRVTCKLLFQLGNEALKITNITYTDYVAVSRGSNIACEAFSIGGTTLSKKIYHIKLANPNVDKLSFLMQHMNIEFFREIGLVTLEKTMILDAMGEVIKKIRGSSTMEEINYYDSLKKSAISTCFNISTTSLDLNAPITTQWDQVAKEIENIPTKYALNSMLFFSRAADKVLLDLFAYGPVLLSTANAITEGYNTAIKTVLPIVENFSPVPQYQLFQTEVSIVAATSAGYFLFQWLKEPLFEYTSNIVPELATVGITFLVSNKIYDSFKSSSTLTKLAFGAAALTYSHYKEDFISYLSLSGEELLNQDEL